MRNHDTRVEKSKEKGIWVGIADSYAVGGKRLLLCNWEKSRLKESSVGRFRSEWSKTNSADGNSGFETPSNRFFEGTVKVDGLIVASECNAEKTTLSSEKSRIGVIGEWLSLLDLEEIVHDSDGNGLLWRTGEVQMSCVEVHGGCPSVCAWTGIFDEELSWALDCLRVSEWVSEIGRPLGIRLGGPDNFFRPFARPRFSICAELEGTMPVA